MEKDKKTAREVTGNSVIITSKNSGSFEPGFNSEEEIRETCVETKVPDNFNLNLEEEEGNMDCQENINVNENYVVCPRCERGAKQNCEECCQVVESLCEQFGYQEDVSCECHDICVQDVKLICVKHRTITIFIPGLDGSVGCRGEFQITGVPELHSYRIFCAEESLRTEGPERCLVVDNKVGVEITLKIQAEPQDIILVHKAIDTFSCHFYEFYTFPEGAGFSNDKYGAKAFKEEIRFIDGSCKTVIFEEPPRIENTDCPRVVIELKVIDKLWKHENLLVSAIKPYPQNITVKEEFNNLHQIGPCIDPCP